ncbi:MAG: GNAT family N-acetyltransferase [Cyanobacteria bacterium HKST-UBA05]|nr:GNAT family N-acetyltransferase [Cyanobacteria bacterium HKST-UBA05]
MSAPNVDNRAGAPDAGQDGPTPYSCLKHQHFSLHDDNGHYAIVPIRYEDRRMIQHWRNEQIESLRQKEPLTDAEQDRYFDTVVMPLRQEAQPCQLLFSFLLDGRCIGYGGLVYIDWIHRRAEFSFLLATSRRDNRQRYIIELGLFLRAMAHVAFEGLGLHRLTSETYAPFEADIEAVERVGMVREGLLRQHVFKGRGNDGVWLDAVLHGWLADEWRNQ